MDDAEQAAADARKHTKIARPIHRTRFQGSTKKLKGKSFGKWVEVAPGKWKYESSRRHNSTAEN